MQTHLQSKLMHIVVFPGWYPNRIDKLSGDFIQRHLQAISLNCRVSVVIPVKDHSIKKAEQVVVSNGNLTELYYYYPSLSSMKWMDGLLSFIRYNLVCLKAAKARASIEKIDIVHLYVLQKNFFVGQLLTRLQKIPYIISEQSTLYIDGRWEKLTWLQRMFYRYSFSNAVSFHAVSNFLLETLVQKLQLKKTGIVIPNVVDTKRFYYQPHIADEKVTFVHVSNMVFQKNADGMLEAFARVKKANSNFILNLVGPIPGEIREKVNALELTQQVTIWNERSYSEVAEIMQQSDVFVFFTRYETFGCVIIEANACGLPVIVSDLPVTRELIREKFSGLFAQSENAEDLAEKILFAIENRAAFDPAAISLFAQNKFNYQLISNRFTEWFMTAVKKKSPG